VKRADRSSGSQGSHAGKSPFGELPAHDLPPMDAGPVSQLMPLIEGLLDAAWLVEPGSLRLLAVNAAAQTLFGLSAGELCELDALALSATAEDVAFWERCAAELDEPIENQTVISRPDGRLLPVQRRVSLVQLGPASGDAIYLVVMRDRSEELRTQTELETRVSELRATLESTTDAILVTDLAGRITNFNQQFVSLWGVPEPLLTQHDDAAVSAWMLRRVADPLTYTRRLQAFAESATLDGCDVLTLRCGKVLERRTLAQRNRGQPIGRVYAFRDVTESVEASRRIEALSHNDTLTGLPNRRLLLDRIEYALALSKRESTPFALLYLNLDRFRPVNERLGQTMGDQLLIELAERLTATMRQVDTVARLGADEFVILAYQADMQRAEGAACRVLNALQQPFLIEGMNLTLNASIGIALHPADGSSPEDLLRAASAAMADLKASGGGGYRFHHLRSGAPVVQPRSRMQLDHAMRQALAAGRFRLHYQPQVDIDSGEIVGVEALMRWRDPELGDVPPTEFIPVAERSGFIVALGDWALRHAVLQAVQWRDKGYPLLMSVNVSALQFQQPDFVDSVARLLNEVGLEGQRLELELTESILVKDAHEALQRLEALARLGVKLAIDDFGTGYSSLAYLKRYPIGRLKIDRSFIKGLPKDEVDVGIVNAIVNLGKALHLEMVAEGVETEAQRLFMLAAGCTQYQGALFSPPIDSLSMQSLLERNRNAARDIAEIKGWIGTDS
jgi:diguanylate cyclase (GGDEF)-like protein/PAS domain S-box-containing protein